MFCLFVSDRSFPGRDLAAAAKEQERVAKKKKARDEKRRKPQEEDATVVASTQFKSTTMKPKQTNSCSCMCLCLCLGVGNVLADFTFLRFAIRFLLAYSSQHRGRLLGLAIFIFSCFPLFSSAPETEVADSSSYDAAAALSVFSRFFVVHFPFCSSTMLLFILL